jgi:hypothetical protein
LPWRFSASSCRHPHSNLINYGFRNAPLLETLQMPFYYFMWSPVAT